MGLKLIKFKNVENKNLNYNIFIIKKQFAKYISISFFFFIKKIHNYC